MRVLQPRRGRDLPPKPLRVDLEGGGGGEELEGDRAIVLEIAGEIDRAHPSLAKLALEAIGPDEGVQT
jgi:hypothetical protein